MANENVQMIYWHVLSGGLDYTIKPLIEYYMGMMDPVPPEREEHLRPARHLHARRNHAGQRRAQPDRARHHEQDRQRGWMAQHFYSYYEYRGCDDFLKDTILPFNARSEPVL